MNLPAERTHRRAQRLLHWYPKEWRSRYGDEFIELLVAQMSDQPRSWRRNADVAWCGCVARIAECGLGQRGFEPVDQLQRSLASASCAMAVFLAFGIAIWSQLTIGWQWSQPDTATTTVAMVVMSGAVLVFVVFAVAAILPIAWCIIDHMLRRTFRGLVRPTLLFAGATSVLIVGARHFGSGWPGTGGHPWAHQGIVPGGVAAFAWASTLSITSYWAHPSALLRFPASEIAWMVVSPLILACAAAGAAKVIRRLDVPASVLRYEARLAQLASLVMGVFLVGASTWVLDGGPGPRSLFHVGAVDVGGLIMMALALAIACRAVRATRQPDLARSAR